MIVPSDKDYKETKLIKQGKALINPDFKSLAEWIANNYKINVLNIYYDITTGAYNKPFPRLNIIFENREEELKFRDNIGNFDSGKQKIIAKKFDELVNGKSKEQGIPIWSFIKSKHYKYDTQDLLVIFTSFKPIARDETNEGIPKSEIDNLKTEINNLDIWEITRFAAGATFFFYTKEQADTAKTNGYIQQLTDKYFDILKKYDEFNYFDRQTFSVMVDSKENFDKNYQSNWYYYYK